MAVNPDIDLRLFMNYWKFGFAVNESNRLSLQFFDAQGEAVHKIYLTEKSELDAYHQLVQKYKAENQQEELAIEAAAPAPAEKADQAIDVEGFRDAWTNLQDTHDFFGLLKTYGVSRTQAMRLAPEGFVEALPLATLKRILETVSEQSLPIMVFTGSKGCIQIHTGETKNLVQTGPWYTYLIRNLICTYVKMLLPLSIWLKNQQETELYIALKFMMLPDKLSFSFSANANPAFRKVKAGGVL